MLKEELHRIKKPDPLAGVIMVVSSEAAVAYTEKDLALDGVNLANVRIMTLSRFALHINSLIPLKLPSLPSGSETALLYSALREALGKENPFGDSSLFPGFGRSIGRALSDLLEANLEAFDLPAIPSLRPVAKDRLLAISRVLATFRSSFGASYSTEFDTFSPQVFKEKDVAEQLDLTEVILYGIYDFNELQYSFIKALAGSIPTNILIPSTNTNQILSNSFHYAAKTIDRITADFPEALTSRQSGSYSFANALFDYGSIDSTPCKPVADVRIFSASDPAAETDLIVGKVADLIFNHGVSPESIGVILWQPDIYKTLLIDAFARASLPVYDGIGKSMLKTGTGRALKDMLALSAESISGRELLELIQHGEIKPPAIESDGTFVLIEQLVNRCGVVKGSAAIWEQALNLLIQSKEGQIESPIYISAASQTRDYILKLFRLLNDLQTKQSLAEMAHSVTRLVAEFLVEGEIRNSIIVQLQSFTMLSSEKFRFDYSDLLQILNASLDSVTVDKGEVLTDGVALLTPMTARTIEFEYLFLPGFTQGNIPAVSRENPLLTDDIRWRVNKSLTNCADRPLPLSSERSSEEKLLFALILSSVKRGITISYPVSTFGASKIALPSHFLLEVCRTIIGASISSDQLRTLDFFDDFTKSDLTTGWETRLVTSDDFPRKMASKLSNANRRLLLKSLSKGQSRFVDRLELSNSLRGTGARWTNYDGMPGLEGAIPTGKDIPITEIEDYAECPFRCWMTRRLKLAEWRNPEISLDITPDIVGSLLHSLYQKLFDLALTTGRIPLTSDYLPWASEQLPAILDSIRYYYRNKCPAPASVWQITENAIIERVEASLPKLIELQEEYLFHQSEKDVEFQVEAGSDRLEGVKIALSGRIDRIDRISDGRGLHVIDYKSGSAGDPTKLDGGSRLQLPLYLRILLKADPALDPANSKASYFQLGRNGDVKSRAIDGIWLAENTGAIDQIVETVTKGLLSGYFPPMPDNENNCRNCPVGAVCDLRSRSSADFRSEDDRMLALRQLREKS